MLIRVQTQSNSIHFIKPENILKMTVMDVGSDNDDSLYKINFKDKSYLIVTQQSFNLALELWTKYRELKRYTPNHFKSK